MTGLETVVMTAIGGRVLPVAVQGHRICPACPGALCGVVHGGAIQENVLAGVLGKDTWHVADPHTGHLEEVGSTQAHRTTGKHSAAAQAARLAASRGVVEFAVSKGHRAAGNLAQA